MRRPAKRSLVLQWPPWAVIAVLLGAPLLQLFPSDEDWAVRLLSNQPSAVKQFEPSAPHAPVSPHSVPHLLRKSGSGAWERGRDPSLVIGTVRNLLDQSIADHGSGSKLDFCPEFTKPDSLKIRLMGTPKNHRSPPA